MLPQLLHDLGSAVARLAAQDGEGDDGLPGGLVQGGDNRGFGDDWMGAQVGATGARQGA